MNDGDRFLTQRQRMVDEQLRTRDIRDKRVLEAMNSIPRHRFVSDDYRHLAYTDGPLPIGGGQTISQPYIVALMTQMLKLKGDEKVLEVGTGSGYQAAVLAYLVREVHSIERHANLSSQAAETINDLGFTNVRIYVGDGTLGWQASAPYDAILVTAAAPEVPQALLEQLSDGGRLVIPVGGRFSQFLQLWERKGAKYTHDVLVPVAFVPLLGKYGWDDDRWSKF